ncbi:MAG: ABC transporter substrate-binding protein [Propionibacteriaceae bacterium]|nr:ABC transporter substrate-binding protein [Propionibacteriaceae bacterium]
MSQDGTCGDGTKITPSIVAASLSYLADPATSSGLKALVLGPGSVTVTADDDAGTVTIELSEPFSGLLTGLTTPPSGIICPAGLADVDSLKSDPDPAAFSGAYSLVSAKPGVMYEFEQRADYVWPQWQLDLEGAIPRKLSFTVGVDPTATENEVKAGSLDVGLVSLANAESFSNRAPIEIGEHFVIFNESATSPFKDEALRRAVAALLSGEEYGEVAYAGLAEVNYTTGSSSLQCASTDPSLLVPFDPQSVIDSGVLKDVEITYSASNLFGPNGAGAEYVYQQLSKAGAKVTYNLRDNTTWASEVLGPDPTTWDMTLFGTVNNAVSLWTPLSRMVGLPIEDGGRNMSRGGNSVGDELAVQAMSADSATEMCEAYQDLQENLLGRVDFVPLVSSTVFYAMTEQIRYPGAAGHDDLTTLRIVG